KAQVPPSFAQTLQLPVDVDVDVEIWHCFVIPGAGSPNTAFVHAVPPVRVLYAYKPLAPYRTCCVPAKAHVPPSFAQTLQPSVDVDVDVDVVIVHVKDCDVLNTP